MNKLLESVASQVGDYRAGELPTVDEHHVERWVGQFEKVVRKPILSELSHVLAKTYLARSRVKKFMEAVISSHKLAGADPCSFWRTVEFLRVQKSGSSQVEMLRLFDESLKAQCGFTSASCTGQKTFLYLDDASFTGNRILNDLRPWIAGQAPAAGEVHIVVMALHTGGQFYASNALKIAGRAAGKKLAFQWWRSVELEDQRQHTDTSDVLRPVGIPADTSVQKYVAGMKHAPVLRTSGNVGALGLFSSEAGRDLLEQEFLKAGCRIRDMCPYLGPYQRPLGNMVLDTLGFGSLLVTFRNCPNNAPLALWAGDPWRPLFARKTN